MSAPEQFHLSEASESYRRVTFDNAYGLRHSATCGWWRA